MYNAHVMDFLKECGWDAFDDYTRLQQQTMFRGRHPILIDEMCKLNSMELSMMKEIIKVMETWKPKMKRILQ